MAASDRAACNRTSKLRIVERQHEAVGGALRDADREDTRQPPTHVDRLIRIEQGVGELADVLFGDLAQREHRVVAQRVSEREERNHVRHERSRHAVGP